MTVLMQKLQVRNRLEVVIAAQKFSEQQPVTTLHS
jgi:DNA-binding NarL/FixJ family response regulator